jgi:hypothetical protein
MLRGLRFISGVSFQAPRFQRRQYDYLRNLQLSDVERFRQAIINNHDDVVDKMIDDAGYDAIGFYLVELSKAGYGREHHAAQRLLRRLSE